MKRFTPVIQDINTPLDGETVHIPVDGVLLEGSLDIPAKATGVVIFAHGSGSSRHSRRNQLVAWRIREKGLGTLLFDLLTSEEEAVDDVTRELRFDIDFLANRLIATARWVLAQPGTQGMRIGFFGSSTGGAAALVAAARMGDEVGAVVSRGGRPDLAGDALPKVRCPTLLIVGGADENVLLLNEEALAELRCEKEIKVIPGATHLFEEYGALPQVAQHAAAWFRHHLGHGTIPSGGVS
jgi:dienelactone hydrolase